MVDTLSILNPLVFRGIAENFTSPETLTLLNQTPKTNHPFPSVTWESVAGSRNIARPNVPNSEARVVGKTGRRSMSAAFVYLREKKVFDNTSVYWIRQVAQGAGDLARAQAEEAILREVRDLNVRFDNYAEWLLWQSLTGIIEIDDDRVSSTVDYQFEDGATLDLGGRKWSESTAAQIMSDVKALKQRVLDHGEVQARDAFVSEKTIETIIERFVHGNADHPAYLLSDRAKDEYYRTGNLPGFLGLNWRPQSAVFDPLGKSYRMEDTRPATEKRFLDEDRVIVANLTDGRPIELYQGPTADYGAAPGFTGKFAKSWEEEDPSARQFLLEWNILPVITRPNQIAQITSVEG